MITNACSEHTLGFDGVNDVKRFDAVGPRRARHVVQVEVGERGRNDGAASVEHRMVYQSDVDVGHWPDPSFASLGSRSGRRSRVRSNAAFLRKALIAA